MAQRPAPPPDAPSSDDVPDVSLRWSERLDRVRRSQARADVTGMTRPPRDADERAFLSAHGRLGPFAERANADSPDASDVPR